MNNFAYSRAADIESAVQAASQHPHSAFIGGGTNLLDLMKYGVEAPQHLIDINRLNLNKIEELQDGSVRIGALARNSDMANHPLIRERYPVLSEALLAGASAQLRNAATTGGNLLQRTRCYYFYDVGFEQCNKRKPGSGCAALEGITRIHAILGANDKCIATHPSDMAVAMAALEAKVQVIGPKGARSIPMADFHRLPGNSPQIDTNLQTGELITAIDLPPMPEAKTSFYLKVRDRNSYAFALVSVASVLSIQNNKIQKARLALGGVAHKPWRVPEAEELLIGKQPGEAAYQAAANALVSGAKTYPDNAFKVELAKRSVVRALTITEQRA